MSSSTNATRSSEEFVTIDGCMGLIIEWYCEKYDSGVMIRVGCVEQGMILPKQETLIGKKIRQSTWSSILESDIYSC